MPDREQTLIANLRRCYEAVNREDFDTAAEILHPEIEVIRPGAQPRLQGADEVRAWMEPDALEDQRWEPLEFRVNGSKVLSRQRVSARGASSGIELDLETWLVWTFDDKGLATRAESFLLQDESEALKAAGLAE